MKNKIMNKKSLWHKISIIIFIIGFSVIEINAQKIRVTNIWSLDLSNEITEAGTDYIGTYTSDASQMLVRVFQVGNNTWSVSVRHSPNNDWDSSITLLAIRTGDGTGTGSIIGGSNYQTVTESDILFFSGQSNRSDIPIQYQLQNISVTIPVILTNPRYRTKVWYTLTSP